MTEHVHDRRHSVAEEAARHDAEQERRHAAGKQQLAEILAATFRLHLAERDECRDHHHKAVAHVRHHDAVEQNEKRCHERVRIHRAVGRQAVHVRDHVQRLGKFVVFEFDRHLGVLVLRGIGQIPGAVILCKHRGELVLLRRREPAAHAHDALGADETLFRLRAAELHARAVDAELERIPVRSKGGDVRLRLLALADDVRDLHLCVLDVLLCRARRAAEVRQREAGRAQRRDGFRQLLLQTNEQHIVLFLVRRDLIQLRLGRSVRQRFGGLGKVHCRGQHAERNAGPYGFAQIQRQVKRLPRAQGLHVAAELGLLAVEPAHSRLQLIELGDRIELLPVRTVVQEVGLRDLRPGAEQLGLDRRILVQQLERSVQARQLTARLRHVAALLTQDRGSLCIRQKRVRFRDLHAAEQHQVTQQSIFLPANDHEPQLFHVYNGHQPFTILSTISDAARSRLVLALMRMAASLFLVSAASFSASAFAFSSDLARSVCSSRCALPTAASIAALPSA